MRKHTDELAAKRRAAGWVLWGLFVLALLVCGRGQPVRAADDDIELGPSADVYDEDLENAAAESSVPTDEGRKTLSFGARGGGWFSLLHAEVVVPGTSLTGTPVAGTNLDVTAELDLPEFEMAPYVEVFLTSRYISLRGDYWRVRRQGKTRLDAEISFDGRTFGAGLPIRATVDIETAGAWLEITPFALDSFSLGLILGARYYRLHGEIESRDPALPLSGADSVEGPLPIVGLRLAIYSGALEVYGEAHGFYLEYREKGLDITAYYLEGEIGAGWNIGDHLAVGGGYRLVQVFLEEKGGQALGGPTQYEVLQHGPMLWVRLRL